MAKIDTLIPFILHMETGVAREYLTLPPEQLFERAARQGFANVHGDRGGLTMCGVTHATYAYYCGRVGTRPTLSGFRNMTYAVWRDILKTLYWDRWHADEIRSQPIANILVDWVWASGSIGVKWPQRLLGVTADGIVGEETLRALNAADSRELFSKLHDDRIAFVEGIVRHSPSQAKFLRGWERRIDDITFSGLRYD